MCFAWFESCKGIKPLLKMSGHEIVKGLSVYKYFHSLQNQPRWYSYAGSKFLWYNVNYQHIKFYDNHIKFCNKALNPKKQILRLIVNINHMKKSNLYCNKKLVKDDSIYFLNIWGWKLVMAGTRGVRLRDNLLLP